MLRRTGCIDSRRSGATAREAPASPVQRRRVAGTRQWSHRQVAPLLPVRDELEDPVAVGRRDDGLLFASRACSLPSHWGDRTILRPSSHRGAAMLFRRFALAAGLVIAAMFRVRAGPGAAPCQPVALRGAAVAQYRPAPGKPHRRCRRPPASTPHVLHGRGEWRRLEDHRRRPDLGADLRRPAYRIDRLDRAGALGPEHHLRRQRRGSASARPLDGRRRLQVGRCRPDVDAARPQRRAADPADRRRPAQPEPPVRGGARPSRTVRTKSGASSARSTAARRSRRCSTRTRTPAATTSTSTR